MAMGYFLPIAKDADICFLGQLGFNFHRRAKGWFITHHDVSVRGLKSHPCPRRQRIIRDITMTMTQCLQDGIYVLLPGTRESVFQEEPCMQRAEGLFIRKYDKGQGPGFAGMCVKAPDRDTRPLQADLVPSLQGSCIRSGNVTIGVSVVGPKAIKPKIPYPVEHVRPEL